MKNKNRQYGDALMNIFLMEHLIYVFALIVIEKFAAYRVSKWSNLRFHFYINSRECSLAKINIYKDK